MGESGQGKYLYCVVRAEQAPKLTLAGGNGALEHLHVIEEGEVAAVVGNAGSETFRMTRSTAMAHQLVTQEVMRRAAALPFSFGTAANSEEDVRSLLRRYGQDFLDQLAYLDGKAEHGLKALWRDKDQPFRDILAEREDIRKLRDAVAHRPPSQSYQERIQVGRMVSEALETKREAEAKAIMERLKPLAIDARVSPIFMDNMVLNAAFLISSGGGATFEAAIRDLDRIYEDRIDFRFTEASPPFNFVRMPINWR